MDGKMDATSDFLKTLYCIRPQFSQQKSRAVHLTEQMLCHGDLSYIPQILSCFPVGNFQEQRLHTELSQLDADMRRLRIICEIAVAEEKLYGGQSAFLQNVNSFEDLIQKYISITFLLRRLEMDFPEDVVGDTETVLEKGNISACAVRKITSCEIFADPEYVCNRALQMIGELKVE